MKKIASSRIKAIHKTFDTTYNLTTNKAIATYLQTYIDCEILAQKLINFYKKDHGKTAPSTLFLPNILKASDYFSLSISRSELVRIFPGGEGKRSRKSPRQLRNAYVHAKRDADALEMLKHFDDHLSLMQVFQNAVKYLFKKTSLIQD